MFAAIEPLSVDSRVVADTSTARSAPFVPTMPTKSTDAVP